MQKPIADLPGVTFRPALREIGTTSCPVCRHKVVVFLTKTNRPFVNCGTCSARVFYNGREAIQRLQLKMKPIKDGQDF
jgi:DNA-directed RNA polymerase subunit RPC12/RpoP